MTGDRKMPSSAGARKSQDRKAAFKARQERIIETQSRPGLSACERLVIAIIGQHENLDTGQCDPGIETVARESGLAERAVYRAIAGAERKGALVITRTGHGGRNGRNSYRLVGGNPDKLSGLNADKKTPTNASENPDKVSPELKELGREGKVKAFPSLWRENEPPVLDAPGSGRAPLRGAAEPFEERPESHRKPEPRGAALPSRGQQGEARDGDDGGLGVCTVCTPLHAAWRTLVEPWAAVRPWPITPRELAIARALFVKAMAAGVPAELILAGADRWIAEIDAPRYLPSLPNWLAACGWEHDPPTKSKRHSPQANGQRRGYQRPQKTDLASLMHELGRTM